MNLTLGKPLPTIDDVEAIGELRRRGFGWLSPEGGLVVCDLHNHLEALASLGVISAAELKKLADSVARIQSTRAWCHKAQDCWHEVGMAEDRAQGERTCIVNGLYLRGWIRLGIHALEPTLHAEGAGHRLRRQKPLIEDLAAMMHLEAKLEPFDGHAWLTGYDRHFPSFLEKDS